MKRTLIFLAIASTALTLTYCGGPKKTTTTTPAPTTATTAAKVSYESSINTLIVGNCSPCHIPAKGGNKKAYDTYDKVKAGIDDILYRIELNPGQRGFMPFRKSEKLSDSTIAQFKKWKEDGMPEH